MTIAPGDHMHASIAEVVPDSNVWTIVLQDVTRNESFSQTVPYASSHLTAEWIEETPLLLGTNAGFAALPNLTSPVFTNATTNGQPANLQASEEMQLIDSNGNVIGTPSAPSLGTGRLQRLHLGDLLRGALEIGAKGAGVGCR